MSSSTSSGLTSNIVGQDHFDAVIEAQQTLKKAQSLERVVSLVGESELSKEDQIIYRRAQIIKNYMTQNFFVTKEQTGKEGKFVPLSQTVSDVKQILAGRYDDTPEETFLYIGNLKDLMS